MDMIKRKKRKGEAVPAMVMIGPVTLWLIAFVAVPLLYVVFMTFCSLDNNYNLVFSFTLDNYRNIFAKGNTTAITNTYLFGLEAIVVVVICGILISYLSVRRRSPRDL